MKIYLELFRFYKLYKIYLKLTHFIYIVLHLILIFIIPQIKKNKIINKILITLFFI